MKNISRRVFIKGMAVAAVATAASTVLTGCKLPTGTEETPVVGFQPVTKTLTADDKTFTITVTSMGVTAAGEIKLGVNVVNELGADVKIIGTADTTDKAYSLVPTAYFNGNASVDSTTFTEGTSTYSDNYYITAGKTISSNSASITHKNNGAFYVVTTNHDDWKNVTLNFVLKQGKSGSGTTPIAETAFTFSK